MKGIRILLFLLGFLIPHQVSSFWIWTPELGRWINPKHYVRDTPEEQFNLGYELYQEGKYKDAIREFEKVVKYFPKSKYAPEAQYYIGKAYEKMGNYYEAFKAYQRIIDKYPYTGKVDEVIELEYRIGNLYFVRSNKDRNLWERFSFSDDNMKAIEIFQKVVENAPYGEYAPLAQFKLGLLYKRIKDYQRAEEAFKKLITNYPTSELVDDATYHLALVISEKEKKVEYSQEGTEEAIKRLEEMQALGEVPPEAEKVLKELKEKKAWSLFKIAKFYERQKLYKSAVIYYEEIVKGYPKTSWAVKALKRIEELRREKKVKQ